MEEARIEPPGPLEQNQSEQPESSISSYCFFVSTLYNKLCWFLLTIAMKISQMIAMCANSDHDEGDLSVGDGSLRGDSYEEN